jgi:hypothetical protein
MIDLQTTSLGCERFQRTALAWLRSGEMTRTNHMLSPLEELAGYNYGFVYLLDVDERTVKIGFSEHPVRRMRELRPLYGEKLRLRSCFVGEMQIERELHRRFAHLRTEYELFLRSDAIDVEFAERRIQMRERLRTLHLCSPECAQLVKGLDLRMLRTWLSR